MLHGQLIAVYTHIHPSSFNISVLRSFPTSVACMFNSTRYVLYQCSSCVCVDCDLCFTAQVMGRCPTVSIDKTDGCQIFLNKDSLTCEIISAKSSEMNVCIPPKDGCGDFVSLTRLHFGV